MFGHVSTGKLAHFVGIDFAFYAFKNHYLRRLSQIKE